jgi:hypothetical protein
MRSCGRVEPTCRVYPLRNVSGTTAARRPPCSRCDAGLSGGAGGALLVATRRSLRAGAKTPASATSRYSARSVATRSRSFYNALIVLATGTVVLTESLAGRLLARIGDGYRSKVDPVIWSTRASAIAKLPKGGTLVQRGGSRSMWEQWSRGDGGFDRREILRCPYGFETCVRPCCGRASAASRPACGRLSSQSASKERLAGLGHPWRGRQRHPPPKAADLRLETSSL